MRWHHFLRVARWFAIVLIGGLPLSLAGEDFHFDFLRREVIEQRLKSFSRNDSEREAILKKMFAESGCAGHTSEQQVSHLKQPNLICVLPGETDEAIIVGAHFDHVDAGEGVVDNWSGASLLPSLYQALRQKPRQHTFIFVSFTGEEQGELGSAAYVHAMSKEDVAKSQAMVNLDTLGLGPTKVWLSRSDPHLAAKLNGLASALDLPLGVVNVEHVGSTDSEQFARRKIPRITIHSVTQETWPILHSPKDKLEAIRLNDYYDTYRLLAAYLALLDSVRPVVRGK